ncbi:serine hydrolase domain-containing protein [uncultured Winogradskyella sp.]|uniref:serine hydrolase domain-containing protein n=1 Tax=uncultured Winogradskyella sp. TaxID=395353 RepID=UPI00261DA31B|nr:serine hydrolase domain-containing protein [uncultured Winogradskyella sp.]
MLHKAKNTIKTALFILLTTFTMACSNDDDVVSEIPSPTEILTQADLTAYLQDVLDIKEVAGFAINIVQNDNVTFNKAFGFQSIEQSQFFSNQTVINVASMSKTFVAAATAKTIEQGYFTLDTPINELLPVDIINLRKPEAVITVRHLVTHTSGIVDDPNTYLTTNYFVLPGQDMSTTGADILVNQLGISVSNPVSLEDYLTEYFVEDGALYGENNFIDAEPGSTWSYSNVATSLMGYVIESATDINFAFYVDTYILQPLQMNTSTFDMTQLDWQKWAIPYLDKNTPLPFYGNHGYPEGGIHTTNDDLLNYLLDMIKGIKGQSNTLFATTFYELMFTPQLDLGIVPNGFAENHGLYWYKTDDSWSHGGNSLGVSSYMEIEENGSYGFSIIANMDATFSDNSPKWEDVLALVKEGIQQYIQNN